MNPSALTRLLAVLNGVGLIVTLVVNYLANALPINGKTTGQISDQYPNLFTPAGITFSIWGIIYLLLIAFMVYQIIVAFGRDLAKSEFIRTIGPWFIIASIANSTWIFAWHYEIILLSLVLMILIFTALLAIYLRLGIVSQPNFSQERYFVQLPFSVYLGWISVATIANVTTLLVANNWNAFGLDPQIWAIFLLIIAVGIALFILFQRKDIAYNAVIIWTLIGIIIKRNADNTVADQGIIITAYIGIAIIIIAIIIQLIRRNL